MAEADTTTPAAPQEDSTPEPRLAPPPAKQKKRSAFRKRDELGLVILAIVLTAIVWAIARGSVIEKRDPIEGVEVKWERPPGSNLDVAFTDEIPTTTVILTCSERDYEDIKQKLGKEGLQLVPGPLSDRGKPSRELDPDLDKYRPAFFSGLLAGRTIPLPEGTVYRIETGFARIAPPDLTGLTKSGLKVELVAIEPADTIPVENVRKGLLKGKLEMDKPTVDDLRLDENLGTAGIRWFVAKFEKWKDEVEDDKAAREKVLSELGPIRVKLRIYGGEEKDVQNEWRWALSDEDRRAWSFRIARESQFNIRGHLLTRRLIGTKEELRFVEENLGKWHWELAIFDDKQEGREQRLPRAGQKEEVDITATLRFRHNGDPGFGGVRFVPGDDDSQSDRIPIKVKRID